MNPAVTAGLFALGGVLVGSLLNLGLYLLTRRHRIQETLRTERQARYTEFIGLADKLLMDLEDDWKELSPNIERLTNANDVLDAERGSAQDSLLRELEQKRNEAASALEQKLRVLDSERLRSRADAVRASRITVELVGSAKVGRHALHLNQKLYELLGALTSTNTISEADSTIAEIRTAGEGMREEAKGDVQLKRRPRRKSKRGSSPSQRAW